jgi:hypothetical protein
MNSRLTRKALKTRVKRTINQQRNQLSRRNALRIRNGTFRPNVPRKNPRMTRPRSQLGGLGSTVRYNPPRQSTANNETRIIHREPLFTLNGSENFAVTTFNINPGLPNTFPWLSQQSVGYESYKVNSMSIDYKFTTNEFIGTGRIVIAVDYDSADTPPTSALQAEQYADNVFGAVAKNHSVRLRPRGTGILGPKRYIRSGALSPNEDIKTYDVAQIYIVTSGQASAAEIGQLWITYDITLCEPQPINYALISQSGVLENANGAGMLITDLPGTGTLNTGVISIVPALNVLTISNLIVGQQYIVTALVVAATVTTQLTEVGTTGITGDAGFLNNVTTTSSICNQLYTANSNVATMTLGGVTVLTTPSRFSFQISLVSPLGGV